MEDIATATSTVKELLTGYLLEWGIKVAFALLILAVGSIIARWISKLVAKAMRRSDLDEMLISFVCNILRWVLLFVVLIAALQKLGVPTTSFVAILGAAGLAIGLALKDSLQNFASGVMIILFRPFDTGDFIQAAGTEGVVEEVRIFSTKMRTPDNREVIVPNGDIFSGTITNNNARDTRRIDLVIGIGYNDDLRQAKQLLEDLVKSEDRVLDDPAPLVAVGELGASSVDILVRPWVNTPDYFATKCDLTERIKLALDDAGISIPYPQMDVHVAQEEATGLSAALKLG